MPASTVPFNRTQPAQGIPDSIHSIVVQVHRWSPSIRKGGKRGKDTKIPLAPHPPRGRRSHFSFPPWTQQRWERRLLACVPDFVLHSEEKQFRRGFRPPTELQQFPWFVSSVGWIAPRLAPSPSRGGGVGFPLHVIPPPPPPPRSPQVHQGDDRRPVAHRPHLRTAQVQHRRRL